MSNSFEESNPTRLSFKSHNDALDYAKQLAQDSNRWLSNHNVNLASAMKVMTWRSMWHFFTAWNSGNSHFVFRAIPYGGHAK